MKIRGREISIFKGDKALWAIFIALTIASILAVYSSIGLYAITSNATTPGRLMLKHLVTIGVSYVVIFVIASLKYHVFKGISALLYGVSLVFSFIAVAAGTRWLMGGHSIQPSEVLKLSTIMVLAWYMYEYRNKLQTPKVMWGCMIITVVSVIAIFGMNFSTAALLYVACLFMMLFGGVDMKWWRRVFFASLILGVGLLAIFYFFGDSMEIFRSSTWGNRINRWLHPTDELTQENMARMAIARGGIMGTGIGSTIHARLMTQAHNDFIFAIIIEEWGAIGAFVVFTLYCLFFRRCIVVVGKCRDVYGATLVAGISVLIFIQALVNMGVAVGLLPVTGQTLPFISFGGSAYLVLSCGFGVIQSVANSNIRREKKEKLKEKEKENETEGIIAGA